MVFLDELRIEKTTPVFLLRGDLGWKHRVTHLLDSLSGRRHCGVAEDFEFGVKMENRDEPKVFSHVQAVMAGGWLTTRKQSIWRVFWV